MNKLSLQQVEELALKFRIDNELNAKEPINVKSLIRRLNILMIYKPMSEQSCGLSLMTPDKKYKFILVNSNNQRGRQHFTIAHELFHLYFDDNPVPHICSTDKSKDITEKNADNFASALLMSREGIFANISFEEIKKQNLSIAEILRLEQIFSVSHQALVYRLKHLKLIKEDYVAELVSLPIKRTAEQYGYDLSLYEKGNENLMIGDFGQKAKILFDKEKISEGHYTELLNKVYGK